MKSTISDLLTSTDARSSSAVETKLSEELSAGVPWWNAEAE